MVRIKPPAPVRRPSDQSVSALNGNEVGVSAASAVIAEVEENVDQPRAAKVVKSKRPRSSYVQLGTLSAEKPENAFCLLAQFMFRLADGETVKPYDQLKLCRKEFSWKEGLFLRINNDEDDECLHKCILPESMSFDVVAALCKGGVFGLQFSCLELKNGSFHQEIMVKVYLLQKAISILECSSDTGSLPSSVTVGVQCVLRYFLHLDCPDYDLNDYNSRKENIREFYQNLQNLRAHLCLPDHILKVNPQHTDLIPRLRLYQMAAVRWMVWRETFQNGDDVDDVHLLYTKVEALDGTVFYYCASGGIVVAKPPKPVKFCKGGILADEMGLGKTVEVLATILLHPKPVSADCDRLDCNDAAHDESLDTDESDLVVEELVENLVSGVSGTVETERQFSPKRRVSQKAKSIHMPQNAAVDASRQLNATFSCKCGIVEEEISNGLISIQCTNCCLFQHAACVNWNFLAVDDPPDYLCPNCRVEADPVPSGATLIISPRSISQQWYQEIQKHLRKMALKVFVYNGVRSHGFIQPHDLSANDIVLTTYETLRDELHYVDLPSSSRLRHPKRFLVPPSPFTAVHWWRICLDEAQMVESVQQRAAEMCLKLSADIRWCITGTPIMKSVNGKQLVLAYFGTDLYGLCLFVGLDPFFVKQWWTRVLFNPYMLGTSLAVYDAIAPCLWRTEKKDVIEQLGIPDQEEKIHWFNFSPVEEHFYRRQHEECSQRAMQILSPLLRLRQACCHPHVARGGRFLPLQKTISSMEELLKHMISKTITEAEDGLRAVLAALNGLAGVQILKNEFVGAAEFYRSALRTISDYKDRVRADPLQLLHTLQNLHEIILGNRDSIPRTLRDDNLLTEASELKQKYLSSSSNEIESALQELSDVSPRAKLAFDELKQAGEDWWAEVLAIAVRSSDLEAALLERVRNALLDRKIYGTKCNAIMGKFRDARGLKYLLHTVYEKLKQSRLQLIQRVDELRKIGPSDALLCHVAQFCHLRPLVGVRVATCMLCRVNACFDEYEAQLFIFNSEDIEQQKAMTVSVQAQEKRNVPAEGVAGPSKQADEDERLPGDRIREQRKGQWADSPLETTLKTLVAFTRQHAAGMPPRLNDSGQRHLKLFDAWKKEFKALRAIWFGYSAFVAKQDELSMAVERLRLRTADDIAAQPADASLGLSVIEPYQIELVQLQCSADEAQGRERLQVKLGQLSYLQHLKKVQFGQPVDSSNAGSAMAETNVHECTICRNEFDVSWVVLNCGHYFCCVCVEKLLKRSSVGQHKCVTCPVCRVVTTDSNMTFVQTKPEQNDDEMCDWPIRGSYSTKVVAILQCVLNVRAKEPLAKFLVFSGWKDLLVILEQAMAMNDIKFASLLQPGKFQSNLSLFKTSADINVLLIPFHSGANGLNIVEANHVILVEPLLNPGAEQQAIGRVHRIGQRRQTTVHRFFIRNTIEQKINALFGRQHTHGSDHAISDDGKFTANVREQHLLAQSGLTIGDLKELFC